MQPPIFLLFRLFLLLQLISISSSPLFRLLSPLSLSSPLSFSSSKKPLS